VGGGWRDWRNRLEEVHSAVNGVMRAVLVRAQREEGQGKSEDVGRNANGHSDEVSRK
jgi:hypothetical protein